MRQKKLNLPSKGFLCPATGKMCWLGSTLLIKPPDIEQMSLQLDGDQASAVAAMVEEAERHG